MAAFIVRSGAGEESDSVDPTVDCGRYDAAVKLAAGVGLPSIDWTIDL